jgi:type II secretory pathway component PulJ
MANHDYDKGFMLLEAIIAISLLSIVLTGLSWILRTSLTQLRTIENQTKILIDAHNTLLNLYK